MLGLCLTIWPLVALQAVLGFWGIIFFFEDDISQEPGLTMMSAWENVGPACLENG